MRSRDTSFLSVGSRDASFIEETIGAGGPPMFDPATLPLTAWLRDYPGAAPWPGTASAGSSAGESALASGSDPTAGAALNGHPTSDWDGAASQLISTSNNNVLLGVHGSVVVLFYADSAPVHSGADYGDGTFLTDPTDAETTFGFTDLGICACIYDGAYKRIDVACGTGAFRLAQFKFDGANLKARVDSGAWSSIACGNYAAITPSVFRIGDSYTSLRFDGRIAELMIASSALADADLDNIKSYFNARYGLSL